MLGPLLKGKNERAAEFRKRSNRYDQKTVSESAVAEAIAEGWEQVKKAKRGVRLRKTKPIDELLENEFWCILYHFGYQNLNSGRQFSIEITPREEKPVKKQIDVFAYDDETIIVAECKSSAVRQKRSLQKDLGEFSANQRPIAESIRRFFKEENQRKIIWMFVTRNIQWSDNDIARAGEYNIRIVRETEMRYFAEIARRLGPTGRYQFHAEYLAKTKVSALQNVKVPAVKTKLGGYVAFFFVAPPQKLLRIAFVNHRDLRDAEAAPSYQRLITRGRLKEISKFIESGGYFANALIVNFKEKLNFEQSAPETEDGTTIGSLILPVQYKSMWVIDGQHRLYAYAEAEESVAHRVPVIAFERLPQPEEGRLFKTINSEQKKVPPNLLDELKGEQDLHSSDKDKQMRAIAARVIEQLRLEIGGPFDDRFKSADLPASGERTLTLTQICNAVVSVGLLGRVKRGQDGRFIQGPLWRDRVQGTIDATAAALSAYFERVRTSNSVLWDMGKAGHLCTNIAVEAHVRLFAELVKFFQREKGEDPRELEEIALVEAIDPYLQPVLDFYRESPLQQISDYYKVPPGSGGPARYFYKLSIKVRSSYPSFNPEGLSDFLKETEISRVERADKQIRLIQQHVPKFVIEKLKTIYDGSNFLQKAVKNKDILVSAFEKQNSVEAEEQGPLETYIDFLEFRKIIETKENWPSFSDTLSILLPDEKKGQSKGIKWFDEINRLRRVPAHPFGKEYKDGDVVILDHVFGKLLENGVIPDND